jgi:3'(2'), 5'-bisphosphate nucleotidase
VDPIDGTWDYLHGGGDYVVSIGLAVGGTPTVGVVYQPARDRLFAARPGRAWTRRGGRSRRRLLVAACDPGRIRLARSHGNSPVVDELIAALAIQDIAVIASVGLKMCLVAAGERDLYVNPSPRCRPWDSCAGAAVLGAAGGRVADLAGDPLWFSPDGAAQRGGLVAATAPLHRILADETHRHAPSRHGG